MIARLPVRRNLRAVPDEPVEGERKPDLSYEWQDRQRILSRDWSGIHTRADRNPPLPFFERVRRTWRR